MGKGCEKLVREFVFFDGKKSRKKVCEKFERKFVIFYGKNLEKKFVKKLLKFCDKL